MVAIVVDASVALAWALPDEISAYADAVLAALETDGKRVPDLWPHEVANGLAIAHIRRRLTFDAELLFVGALERLVIDIDRSLDAVDAFRDGTAIAARYGLTAYDAIYVGLAAREGLTLATLDRQMRDVALRSNVTIFTHNSELRR